MYSLPLLKKVDSFFPEVNLENILIIASQHILGTNITLFKHLFNRGLNPNDLFLIGKCYSTNKGVLKKFKKIGVNVSEKSTEFNSHISFDNQFNNYIKDFLIEIKKKVDFKKYNKIILIDDGGYLIYHANTLLKNIPNIIGVEQTSSGYTKLKKEKLNFPVINVARSETKLKIESYFIAETIVEKLLKQLKKIKAKPKKVLIVGMGPLGKNLSKKLKKYFEIYRYDIIHHKSDFGKVSLNSILNKFDLIMGSTGETIINSKSYNSLKKEVILVNASSSDREFSAVNLRKLAPKTRDCHKNIYVKNIHLLNCRFPINFGGKKHSTTPKKIQITRSLILSGIYLARINDYKNGFIDLDKDLQNKIMREFKKL